MEDKSQQKDTSLEKITQAWREASYDSIKTAAEDIDEYPAEIQAIIKAEIIHRQDDDLLAIYKDNISNNWRGASDDVLEAAKNEINEYPEKIKYIINKEINRRQEEYHQTHAPASLSQRLSSSFYKVILIFIALIIAVFGEGISQILSKKVFNHNSNDITETQFTETDWAQRDIHEISFDAPFAFIRDENTEKYIMNNMPDAIETFEIYKNSLQSNNLNVMVSRVVYKPNIQVNLDGAVDGAITQAALNIKDLNPQYTSFPITINGLNGRTVTYKYYISGHNLCLKAIFINSNKLLWQIQVIYLDDKSTAEVSRILESVTIRT